VDSVTPPMQATGPGPAVGTALDEASDGAVGGAAAVVSGEGSAPALPGAVDTAKALEGEPFIRHGVQDTARLTGLMP
jgi:hypothetical protein